MKKRTITFGTDGWRGLLDEELNDSNIQRVAQAFADYLNNRKNDAKVAIGYDGRDRSDTFAAAFASVLHANGIRVLLSAEIIPTPLVSFMCVREKCDAGVMITASHNPPQYNGIKFKSAQGSPFATEETEQVEKLLDRSRIKTSRDSIPVSDFMAPYLKHIEEKIDFKRIQSAGFTIAIDSMGGAGGYILQNLLKKHDIEAHTIFGDALPDFGGRLAEPVERNLQPLSQFLKSGNFSLGFATDGDADRLGVMTNTGAWMNVQETILYLAEYYSRTKMIEGPIVKTASVTDKIYSLFPGNEDMIADVQVGFKYVAESMMDTRAAFGAEESGGFGFKEHLPERDGIFSALIFLEMMADYNKLDTFIEEKRKQWGRIHYGRIDLHNDAPGRHEVLPALAANKPLSLGTFLIKEILTYSSSRGIINGIKLRLQGNPRWVLLRVSETEPIVRIYAEGEAEDEIESLLYLGQKNFETGI